MPLGLIDGLGSASSVARDVIGQKDLVDFTIEESPFDRFSKSWGQASPSIWRCGWASRGRRCASSSFRAIFCGEEIAVGAKLARDER